jgi:hypothetical protein
MLDHDGITVPHGMPLPFALVGCAGFESSRCCFHLQMPLPF